MHELGTDWKTFVWKFKEILLNYPTNFKYFYLKNESINLRLIKVWSSEYWILKLSLYTIFTIQKIE